VVGYEWSFGDGVSTTGQNVSHTYAQDGIYTVTLVVTDNDGLTDTITTTATVGNVAPLVAGIVGATDLLPGETYAEAGTFSDPGADAWSGTVNFGDGGGAVPLAIAGQAFALSHTYHAPGAFTVTLAVSDGIAQVGAAIDGLAATGTISASAAHSMRAKLAGAMKKVAAAHRAGAVQKLESAVHALDALVRSGRLAQTEAAATRMLLTRTIAALSR
jgi:hypothetical protein